MTPELERLLPDLPVGSEIHKLVVEVDEMICRARFDLAELRERHEKSEADWRAKIEKLEADFESTRREFYTAMLEKFEPQGNA